MRARCRCASQRPAALPLLAVMLLLAVALGTAQRAIAQCDADSTTTVFPSELVDWVPYRGNPIFTAQGPGHWDVKIRERGWILREDEIYHLWFTGYDGTREGIKQLGYAVSFDGIQWTRSPNNPLCRNRWVEDMMIVKHGDTYYMFAEGPNRNHAEMLTSENRVDWTWEGPLDVRLADGKRPVEEPCGTPTVWIENGVWYLFYERLDLGIWLATSNDPRTRVWANVEDEPVLVPGPADYDKQLIAMNQVIKHGGAYFAFYHGSGDSAPPRTWSTNVARSIDLVHWQKFPGNPIVEDDKSSGIVVHDGRRFRLYTMHEEVDVFYPRHK